MASRSNPTQIQLTLCHDYDEINLNDGTQKYIKKIIKTTSTFHAMEDGKTYKYLGFRQLEQRQAEARIEQ